MLQNILVIASPIKKILIFDLLKFCFDFVLSNFQCQNAQTSVGGEGVQANSEHQNFLRPYHPHTFGQCPKFRSFFNGFPNSNQSGVK